MRIDSELFRLVGERVRITLQPGNFVWLPVNTRNKHYEEYCSGRPSELLVTDKVLCATFTVGGEDKRKLFGGSFTAQDLNFKTVDSTSASAKKKDVKLTCAKTDSLRKIVQIQNDFSRRRQKLQKHLENPGKRDRKLKETRGRQRNRIRDVLHKLTTAQVRESPDTSFIFENLKGIRKNGDNRGRKFRAYLNRWPYRMYQGMIEYKSPRRTVYVDPRGTSSRCPVCGGRLKHPAWGISSCATCGVAYDRNRLASLAIFSRGLHLCGYPFTVSADASWPSMKDEYLYAGDRPDIVGAAAMEEANASNKTYKIA
jgi:putative transposase